jgi:hypothetical protein
MSVATAVGFKKEGVGLLKRRAPKKDVGLLKKKRAVQVEPPP